MKHCGKGVYLRPTCSDLKGLWNMSIGDGSSIPKGSVFYCTGAPLTIGKKSYLDLTQLSSQGITVLMLSENSL